jgi:hypothetical protein
MSSYGSSGSRIFDIGRSFHRENSPEQPKLGEYLDRNNILRPIPELVNDWIATPPSLKGAAR